MTDAVAPERLRRKGVMITGTAELRNPNHHAPSHTIDTLDFEFTAEVSRVVARALSTLAA